MTVRATSVLAQDVAFWPAAPDGTSDRGTPAATFWLHVLPAPIVLSHSGGRGSSIFAVGNRLMRLNFIVTGFGPTFPA